MDPIIIEIFQYLDHDIKKEEDLTSITLSVESLKDPALIQNLYSIIPKVKSKYKSNSLTCLHKNSMKKQKFPAINFLRQILKCNGYLLNGYYICNGYNKKNGAKLLNRFYNIKLLVEPQPESISIV
jgi:hypothetical protein